MAKPKSKHGKPKPALDCAFGTAQERLPPLETDGPQRYQMATGTGEEIVDWLRGIPRKTRVIAIQFPSEASYRMYGPIIWQVAQRLPEIAARIRRRQIDKLAEQLFDGLMLESSAGRKPNKRIGKSNARPKASSGGGVARKSESKAKTQQED